MISYQPLNVAINSAAELGAPVCVYGGFLRDILGLQKFLERDEAGNPRINSAELYDIDGYVCMSANEFISYASKISTAFQGQGSYRVTYTINQNDSLDVINIISVNQKGEEVWVTIFRTPDESASAQLPPDQKAQFIEAAMANMTYSNDKSYMECHHDRLILRDPQKVISSTEGAKREIHTASNTFKTLGQVTKELGYNLPQSWAPTLRTDRNSMFARLIDQALTADSELPFSHELFMALEAFARLPKYLADGFRFETEEERYFIVGILNYLETFGVPASAESTHYTEKFSRTAARGLAEYLTSEASYNVGNHFMSDESRSAYPRAIAMITKVPVLRYLFPDLIKPLFGRLTYINFESPLIYAVEALNPYTAIFDGIKRANDANLNLPETDDQELILQYETLWLLSGLINYYEDRSSGGINSINRLLACIFISDHLARNILFGKSSDTLPLASSQRNRSNNLSKSVITSKWPKSNISREINGFGMHLDEGKVGLLPLIIEQALPPTVLRKYVLQSLRSLHLTLNRRKLSEAVAAELVYPGIAQFQQRSAKLFELHQLDIVTLNRDGMYTLFMTDEFQKLLNFLNTTFR